MAFGVLSGKYRNNQRPKGSRLQLFENYFLRYSGKLSSLAVEGYYKIAKKYNISLAQLSLSFVNQQKFVTSTIIGATTIKQLKENIDSVNINLTTEIIDELNLVHKSNPNPSIYRETRKLLKRIPSYIFSTIKLILRADWNQLIHKLNKILIEPIKVFFKK